jgi:hypothetical protein
MSAESKKEIIGCLKDIRTELRFQRETLNQLKSKVSLDYETWERFRIEPLEERVHKVERALNGK